MENVNTTQYIDSYKNTLDFMKPYMQSMDFFHVHHLNTEDITFLNKLYQNLADIYIWQNG